MTTKRMKKRIQHRKALLNLLLKFINPSNKLMVMLSQNLDKDISRYQCHLYKLHKRSYKIKTFNKLAA
ncbi:hypothetical protein [Clostridium sp. Ade.TY]|uniref:hypothetical protein n=1 Tax=Clostridium sp. Ade.TY TaxID=1391647 RepID=UPI0004675C00|nr:hypothetical protein [Clostridium sp. Ade.TY]